MLWFKKKEKKSAKSEQKSLGEIPRRITDQTIQEYSEYMRVELERKINTVKTSCRNVRRFLEYAKEQEINKELLINYKGELERQVKLGQHTVSSVNTYLSSLNTFFQYMGWRDMRVKLFKVQKECYYPEKKNLTEEDYSKLLKTAMEQGKVRLALIIMTICALGLRVSEINAITVDAVRSGRVFIYNKNKYREVRLTTEIRAQLLTYIDQEQIESGVVFRTRSGNSVNRSNIWRDMKKLCESADVDSSKVYPHSLRHLFARKHYRVHKDIAKLADILGHSNVNTTRIYTLETCDAYMEQIAGVNLVKPLLEQNPTSKNRTI